MAKLKLDIRFVENKDTELILKFIKELTEYENMINEVSYKRITKKMALGEKKCNLHILKLND